MRGRTRTLSTRSESSPTVSWTLGLCRQLPIGKGGSHGTCPDNYEENLSFDRMLSVFGVDNATTAAIQAHEISEKKDGTVETSFLEQFSLRWLGKALIGLKPKGCLTDLVNLIFAMESKEPNKDMPEREIVETFKLFAEKIKAPFHRETALQNLWIPDMLMHDAENDDMLCWVLWTSSARRWT